MRSIFGLGARVKVAAATLAVATLSLASGPAGAQDCSSPNPNDWPESAKPYFMIIMDTSGSMTNGVGSTDSCLYGTTRRDHGRCAIRNTVQAFSEANFGLASFTGYWETAPYCHGHGDCGGANILVDVQRQDEASNVPEILKWVNNVCSDGELWADNATPLAQALSDVRAYFNDAARSPLSSDDPTCRPVNVILVTDGSDTCPGNPVTEAGTLFQTGVTVGGKNWKVKTHVINFAGGVGLGDDIANAGGTGAAIKAANEATLSAALANIIADAILPEDCNNIDDNCNGCVDEGYAHYCNERADCCTSARLTCLADFAISGDPADLPCVTESDANLIPPRPLTPPDDTGLWLCDDPLELCDGIDNNCDGEIDEGFGDPVCCPQTEQCNGVDDDCDGVIDENGTNGPYSLPGCVECQPSAEICDGCDNDCDGLVDEGIDTLDCGFSPPSNCAGTRICAQLANVSEAGACHAGGNSYGNCSSTPGSEICDGLDNDCNGQVDELAATPCDIPGQSGLVYKSQNALSVCERGQKPCNGACGGYTGPSTEICDGLDNDCDGQVDEDDGSGLQGVGLTCGPDEGRCEVRGQTICQNGSIVCAGGDQPEDEICDGIDNDCDGLTDEAPLVDAPANPRCWGLPSGGCPADAACQHGNLSWCPPPGGECKDVGTLSSPCTTGTLICNGAARWFCQGGVAPAPDECDGADNDCNGQVDDNLVAPVGDQCGSDIGMCEFGTLICDGGVLDCDGGVTPVEEICDGLNNDCDGDTCESGVNCPNDDDGDVDEGINLGEVCAAEYDTALYPGTREGGACTPGENICDPLQPGGVFCEGGTGPQPEICDGIDNDCDGQIDEAGPAPDGIDGSEDPNDPTRHLGDACGSDEGMCTQGTLRCTSGRVDCFGGIGPQAEQCDCLDNDCDGRTDEDVEPGEDPMCSPGKVCVEASADNCQCVGPCETSEFPCPTGTECRTDLTKSHSEELAGSVCVATDPCGDCENETQTDSIGRPLCGPAGEDGAEGTKLANGRPAPPCECVGGKCQDPCAGVVCPDGTACYAEKDGEPGCQPDKDCNFFGCVDGKVCHAGACVEDPCNPNPCAEGEVCKPNSDFDASRCVPSCADVTCEDTEICVDGECQPSGCEESCAEGNVCKPDGTCGNECPEERCEDGSLCDPATGACGDDPCEGVACPPEQECRGGECWNAVITGGGGSGGGAGTGAAGNGAGGNGGNGGNGPPGAVPGKWGLASGGGGCTTSANGSSDAGIAFGFALAGLAMARARRRRKRVQDGKADERRAV